MHEHVFETREEASIAAAGQILAALVTGEQFKMIVNRGPLQQIPESTDIDLNLGFGV